MFTPIFARKTGTGWIEFSMVSTDPCPSLAGQPDRAGIEADWLFVSR